MRFHNRLSITVLLVLLPVLPIGLRAQISVTINNEDYHPRVIETERRSVLYVPSFAPTRSEAGKLPTRRVEVPCGTGDCPQYGITRLKYAEPVQATPWYYVEFSIGADSGIVQTVRPFNPATIEPGGVQLSQKLLRRNSGLVRILEFPLVSYDPSTNECRWVEEIEFAPLPTDQTFTRRVETPMEEIPGFYGAMPFVGWSKDLDTAGTWLPVNATAVRCMVRADGLYKLDRDWFVSAGVNPSSFDPRNTKLYRKGVEIPLLAVGTEDGTLDQGDAFIFWGERNYPEEGYRFVRPFEQRDRPYPEFTSKYSDSTAYWVLLEGTDPARIVTKPSVTPLPTDTLDWAYQLIHYEEDAILFNITTAIDRQNMADWTTDKTWVMGWLGQSASDRKTVNADNVKPGISSHVWYKAMSAFGNPSVSPNHKLLLSVNSDPPVDSVEFNVNEQVLLHGTTAPSAIVEGPNTVTIQSIYVQPPEYGKSDSFRDWFDLEYPRFLVPRNGQLSFRVDSAMGEGPRLIKFTGFNASDVTCIRQSEHGWYRLDPVYTSPSAPYTMVFADTLVVGDRYFLASTSALLQTNLPRSANVVDLRTGADAEYILISSRDLRTEAEQYAAFIRDNYSLRTRLVEVEDIYDNYSFGLFNPEAIKIFLYDALTKWTVRPEYVLLAGDANYNYKSTTEKYSRNIVPSHGFPVGDMWYVSFDTLGLNPVISLGRLPVRNGGQLLAYLQRHRDYITRKPDLWNKTSIHFSGGFLSDGEAKLAYYRSINEDLIQRFITPQPLSGKAVSFYKTITPPTDLGPYPRDFIRSSLDSGGILYNYIGHSGTQTWDNGIGEASQLDNKVNRFPLVSDFGCSTGKFAEPNIDSFSEEFVVKGSGMAIAYIGNSALGFESTSERLPREFYGKLFRDGIRSIGDAHRLAKKEFLDKYGTGATNAIAMRTNTLVGDPVIQLPLPNKTNVLIRPEWIHSEKEILTDAMDTLRFSIEVQNHGLHFDDSMLVRIEEWTAGVMTFNLDTLVQVPGIKTNILVGIPGRNAAGSRQIRVSLDVDNRVEESDETDNQAAAEFNVLSTVVKVADVEYGRVQDGFAGFTILNPSTDPGPITDVQFEFDASDDFSSALKAAAVYGKTVSTLTALPPQLGNGKYHWRVRLNGPGQQYVGPFRFWHGQRTAAFVQRDSADFSFSDMKNITLSSRGAAFAPINRHLRVISSGWLDGNFGSVERDGINLLPQTFFRAYYVVVFDSLSLEIKRSRLFDTYGSGAERTALNDYLTSVESGEIVAISTADEPASGAGVFRDAIKALGSIKIDSLVRNASWSLIGWRGAAPGSVPEAFTRPGAGKAICEADFLVVPDSGWILSPAVGPASAWRSIRYSKTGPAEITTTVLGIDTNGVSTELSQGVNQDTLDIAQVNSRLFPSIKVMSSFVRGASGEATELGSLAVDYATQPELAVNYQSVFSERDTLVQGDDAHVRVGILNVGDGTAGSFPVHVDVVGEDNVRRDQTQYTVASLPKNAWHDTTIAFDTRQFKGTYQVIVTVDRDNVVEEQFETNNAAITRFTVLTDTSRPNLEVFFDGNPPVNNEYIRPTPDILVRLIDSSPLLVTNPNSFYISLNDTTITASDIRLAFTPATPGTPATMGFKPVLTGGEHVFKFNARDASGNLALDEPLLVRVKVDVNVSLRDVYNFPNPFSDASTFTFVLTGAQPPDGMQLKLYTVGGKLIRTMEIPASGLRVGFNAVKWDGRDEEGDELANGVYFYKLVVKGPEKQVETIGRIAKLK